MKNRNAANWTSGSVSGEAEKPPHLFGRRRFSISQLALPHCRLCRGSRGRKPIRRARCGSSSVTRPAAD